MQTITLDLKKNPEIADFAVDKEPGDRVAIYGTIKSKDDQSMVVTVVEAGDDPDDRDEEEKDETDKKTEAGNQGSGDVVNPPGDGVGMEAMIDET